MTSSDYPVLGFDPAPGTVATVQSVASDYQQVSAKMGEAHQALTKIGRQEGLWEGKAAEAFAGTVGELPRYLDQAHRSLGGAAKTLTQWSEQLTSLQQRAYPHTATFGMDSRPRRDHDRRRLRHHQFVSRLGADLRSSTRHLRYIRMGTDQWLIWHAQVTTQTPTTRYGRLSGS